MFEMKLPMKKTTNGVETVPGFLSPLQILTWATGPYNLNYTRFDLCSGPKAKNLTEIGFSMSSEGFTFIAHVNLTFFGPTQIEEVKIVVYSMKNNKMSNVLWTYKLNDPCKHYALATMINTLLKAPNCIVNKGKYIRVLNFEEVHTLFFGTSFFYGEFLLKTTVISKKGNILCLNLGLWFTKKSNNN
ncbi:uncharacterized protein LOC120627422 [Pararge aegeria]|uniref:uncharacterized protein LOC120627422 n=1 Tax=Pararge aegeria TaxID=116150 RepID=UPI0019D1A09C|nr:uncharacterized protein LOC120627422 [Pararge aegeria]